MLKPKSMTYFIDENELPFTESYPKTLNSDEIDDINLWIYRKDKYNISDQAYDGYWYVKCIQDKKEYYRFKCQMEVETHPR